MHTQLIVFGILTIAVIAAFASTNSFISGFEKHFGSKTPYRVVVNKNDNEIKYPGCTATRMWAMIRHGTRNPGRKLILKAQNHFSRVRDEIVSSSDSTLSQQQKDALRKWSMTIDPNEEKHLLPEGEDELIEMAERMQKRFPQLLADRYDPSHYKFKYTAKERTKKSAESFAVGLFQRHNTKQIQYLQPLAKDPVLRFYKLCKRWKTEVDKNPDAQSEVKRFAEGDEMKKVVEKMEVKGGITGLTTKDAFDIYMVCAFETAANKFEPSPWCALLDDDSIRTLEYLTELEHYYVDGYGNELNGKIACPAIVDMLKHINPKSTQPNATFYFTHSGTMIKLLAHLGLYRDDFVLTHRDLNRERKFRISEIDAFATNVVFITFDCGTETKVLTMHQERVVHLPGCPSNNDLCSYDSFLDALKGSVDNCEFEELCKLR